MSAYRKLEAKLHDIFWEQEGEPAELPLLEDFLLARPGRSLEIGCGSGRLLIRLLLAGFDVEGLDNSPDMLDLCRKASRKFGIPNPVLHSGNMETFRPPHPFASCLLPAFTFQFAEDPGCVLRRFAAILPPGGAIYLTVFRPMAELAGELPYDEWFDDHRVALPDGGRATLESRHTFDRTARILVRRHRYAYFAPGDSDTAPRTTHTSTHRLRWFEPGELESLLESSGFSVVLRIAEFDPEEPVDNDTQILTIHAVRSP